MNDLRKADKELLPYNMIFNIPWRVLKKREERCGKKCSDIRILILNAPCYGLGDLSFAVKMRNMMLKWYNCTVHITTTRAEECHKIFGVDKKQLIPIETKRPNCRRFCSLKFVPKYNEKYDLLFVLPLNQDLYPDRNDVKKFINYSNAFNTFFFSEYNDRLVKFMDFQTGIGTDNLSIADKRIVRFLNGSNDANRLGMFMEPFKNIPKKPDYLPNHYAVAYMHFTKDSFDCFVQFVELITQKYCEKYPEFSILTTSNIGVELLINSDNSRIMSLKKYVGKIVIKTKEKETLEVILGDKPNTLIIRQDIFPIPRAEFISTVKHGVRDVLVTGDQTVSMIVADFHNKKNLYYQIFPHKTNFAENLSKLLPNKHLKYLNTSCGGNQAKNYKGNYTRFLKTQNMEYRMRPKLDAVMLSVNFLKENEMMKDFSKIVMSKRSIKSVIREFAEKHG